MLTLFEQPEVFFGEPMLCKSELATAFHYSIFTYTFRPSLGNYCHSFGNQVILVDGVWPGPEPMEIQH